MDNLHSKLFSAADNLRSKMDASEYKNYLLGLIFYKYLSDKLLVKVVEVADEAIEAFDTPDKQVQLYRDLLADSDIKADLIETLIDTLGYEIDADYLFNVLTNQAKQNIFQLNDLKKAFIDLSTKFEQYNGLFDDVD